MAESPGKTEMDEGIPLCGWSGQFTNSTLSYYGLKRNEIRVENIYQSQKNYTSKEGKQAAQACGPSIWQVIAKMPNLRTVIALGEASLRELSGYRQWESSYKAALAEHKKSTRKHESWVRARVKAQPAWDDKMMAFVAKCVAAANDFDKKHAAWLAKPGKKKEPILKPKKHPVWPKALLALEPIITPEPSDKRTGCYGITDFRGSPLWLHEHAGKVRLFPIIHPAACAPKRMPRLRPLILSDFRRACEFHKGTRSEDLPEIEEIRTSAHLRTFLSAMPDGRVGIDLEWSRKHGELVSIGIGARRVGVIVFFSEAWQMSTQERGECFTLLQAAFDKRSWEWGGHFVASYDRDRLQQVGLHFKPMWDSLYSFHILFCDLGSPRDEESEEISKSDGKKPKSGAGIGGYSLGFVASVLTDLPYHKDMLDRDAAELPLPLLVEYNGRDVFACWRAQQVMDREGAKELPNGLFQRELDLEMDLAWRALKMNKRGIPIIEDERQARLAQWLEKQQLIAEQVATLSGMTNFNIGSGPQLARALESRGIKVKWNAETGNPKLGGNEVVKLQARYPQEPLLKLVLEHRKIEKEIVAYSQMEPHRDGMWRVSWKPHGTTSGRWSSTPNSQNLTHAQRECVG